MHILGPIHLEQVLCNTMDHCVVLAYTVSHFLTEVTGSIGIAFSHFGCVSKTSFGLLLCPVTPFGAILTNPNHSWHYWTQHTDLDSLSLPPGQPQWNPNPCQQFSVTLHALPVILPVPQTAQTTWWTPDWTLIGSHQLPIGPPGHLSTLGCLGLATTLSALGICPHLSALG